MWNKSVKINDDDVVVHMANVCKYDADRICKCAKILSDTGLGPKIMEQSIIKTDGKLYSLSFRTEKLKELPRFVVPKQSVMERVKTLHSFNIAHGDIGKNVMYRLVNGEYDPVFIDYEHNVFINEIPEKDVEHCSVVNYGSDVVKYDLQIAEK